jgi:hypothetical protein
MSIAIAKNLMADMKLLGMLAAFYKVVAEATRDQTSYSELLDAPLQAETDYRQERKAGNRLKTAKRSPCAPLSRTSTLLPVDRSLGHRSKKSTVCSGYTMRALSC